MSSLIAPEDLDATLDSDVPIVLVLENVDNDTTARLRRRQPLLLIDLETCDMADLVEALRPHIQTLIDRLIRAPDLHIGDDLQQVLDLGLYNPRLGSLFETLWVARFEHAEQRDRDRSVRDLLRATFEDPSPLVRNDALLFWLTLLRQNVASTTGQVLLLLTNPAGLDEPLAAFIRSAEHWATLGSPVRVVTDLATVS